jgi:hypothetical protein
MARTITSEIVVAYSQCPRKAFFLMFTEKLSKNWTNLPARHVQHPRKAIAYTTGRVRWTPKPVVSRIQPI